MKKLLGFLFLMVVFSAGAQAQSPMLAVPLQSGGSVSMTWTRISGATSNMYRAPCAVAVTNAACPAASEGVFTKVLNSTTATIYLDLNVIEGQSYSYYVTAVCSGTACGTSPSGAPYAGESAHSNHAGATIPFTPVPPPAPVLTITTVAVNFRAGSQTVYVAWNGDNRSTYELSSRKGVLLTGSATSVTGSYWIEWSGRKQQDLSFHACDSLARCVTQALS